MKEGAPTRKVAPRKVAVVVGGRKAGTILHVGTGEKCKFHGRVSRYQVSPQEREQRREIALATRVQKEARLRVLQAVRLKLPGALTRAEFDRVALDYFRRLGHGNHHRVFQAAPLRKIETEFDPATATAISGWLSPLKSPGANPLGPDPVP